MENKINLYNNAGYVKYVDHMGSDLSFTRAARASFAKDSTEWNEKEEKLLKFLIREKHNSVFRHACMTFQIKAPLFVARQHFKYQVASAHIDDQNGWNEMSKRYVTSNNEFFIPNKTDWRYAATNAKQGSSDPIDPRIGELISGELEDYINLGQALYEKWLNSELCAEQARLFLPAYGLMINYQWTVSFANLIHFLEERLHKTAQLEIQQLASAIKVITEQYFPETLGIMFE